MIQRNALRFGNSARRLLAISTMALVAGCITVNVNFPESAVQRAADDFVRDLYKGTVAGGGASDQSADMVDEAATVKAAVKKSSKKKPAKSPPKSEPTTWHLSFGMAKAFAGTDPEINTASPKAQSIKARMRARVAEIAKYKQKGAICESADAMLVLKPDKAGPEGAKIAKIVKDENADRDELYAEIQDANHINDRKQAKIRKFFAAAFKDNSPAGTCFEE